MTLSIELPQDLEQELSAEARRLGLPLPEYALRLLATRGADSQEKTPFTGAELVAFWQSEGLIGTRPEITDSPGHARRLRESAEQRS